MSSTQRGPYIGSMTRLVWQWVRRQIHAEVVAAGYDDLNPAHVSVFRYPSVEGWRPSQLADDMQITKQSVNELLGYLEKRGYLLRERDPYNSRSRIIRLTDRGQAVEDTTFRAAENAERIAGELLGKGRVQELRRTLADLVDALNLADKRATGNETLPSEDAPGVM
ncbi:MAG: winged helix DNA-binding protein [Nitriliruptorales bacterium]|nr:winged helix DNA-binding protein [Nitriliruptorales bacterium]